MPSAIAAAPGDPAVVGRWSAPIDVGVDGIHAALLRTGRVLLYNTPDKTPGSEAKLFDPVRETVTDVSIQVARDEFCSGLTVGPDGRLILVGGMRGIAGINPLGSANLTFFDPMTNRWTFGPRMVKDRYYPTVLELQDGRTLVFNGSGTGLGIDLQHAMEVYDPVANRWTMLPPSANSDAELYSKAFLLPDGRVFRAGPQAQTAVFDPATNRWSPLGRMRLDRPGGTAVLLPDLRTVLTAGGGFEATNTVEAIDLSQPSPQWRFVAPMKRARSEFNLVQLPDGTVLGVGGGKVGGFYRQPVKEAELYDPTTDGWTLMAAQRAQRTYHSTAVLLPDGRVLSAGSDSGSLSDTVELYSPPYLFQGPRPAIASPPRSIAYGQAFDIGTPDAASVERVVLIRPGATTHANNFDQRHVDLAFASEPGVIRATAPSVPALAPPGYYLLFILNGRGVPSVARFVLLA
jgi:hypothetical protein